MSEQQSNNKIYPITDEDHFDRIPDSLLLVVFNMIGDVKSLGRCCLVSRRFHSLVPQVDTILVRVDCVISDEDSATKDKFCGGGGQGTITSLAKLVINGIVKTIQTIGHFVGSKKVVLFGNGNCSASAAENDESVTHPLPTQALKHFHEIRKLRIEFPNGELGVEDGILLKWRADFGSTLENCVLLGATSVDKGTGEPPAFALPEDHGVIPDSFYASGGLKLRIVWTIGSLIAASARHYLLQPIIAEHHTLDNLTLTDADGQGVLCMNREQLEELRLNKPLSASTSSKRTLVPALNMRLWYAPQLELPNGDIWKGATLVVIRPCEQSLGKKEVSDGSWISNAFEDPYCTAAKLLIKRRTYCLEMNSF